MATVSVRAVEAGGGDRQGTLSLKRDVFGVYGSNDQTRSLVEQLRLILSVPFLRLALVTVRPLGSTQGQYQNLQRDLDVASKELKEENEKLRRRIEALEKTATGGE